MSVIDVALALFTLMTEFSMVRVGRSSWDGFKILKFSGSNLDSSMNSPVRISLTSLASSLCTESIAVSVTDVEFRLEICDSGRPLLVDTAEAAEEVGVTSPEDSPAGVAGSGAGGGKPLKARTAACAAADAAFSIASFSDPCTKDCTWVSWVADKSPSCGDSQSNKSWT